jgi:calcineurin-like phosphoesterase family protein
MNRNFFIADTHFNHINVLKYTSRSFSCIEEMNESIIQNWNKEVRPEDNVFHLGDFGFHHPDEKYHPTNILKRLHGNKHLILGNHDKQPCKGWSSINQYLKINIQNQNQNQLIVLLHYPMESWEQKHHDVWHFHGHCHGTLPDNPKILRIDVGLDAACLPKFAPISFEEICELMKKKDYIRILPIAKEG